jgi:hypothetical protein
MPTVAIIEGVKIQFYPDEHLPPHFHAVFAEFIAKSRSIYRSCYMARFRETNLKPS